jgi:Protein of unknown function (DUF664)
MAIDDILIDGFDRVRQVVHSALRRATEDQLAYRPDPEANSVAWLVWHLTRVQDDHVADAFGHEQVWTSGGWVERFQLPFTAGETGYGQSAEEVGSVRVPADLLAGYHDAVHARTVACLRGIGESELQRIVDRAYDPPVTLAVRLVSVISDDLQHAGQASYVLGLSRRAGV